MKRSSVATLIICTIGVFSLASNAEDEIPFQSQIEARQAFMNVYRFNLGILGGMARGDIEYDADQANAAANNLLAASKMDNRAMWPPGSDSNADGLAGISWAKAAAWADDSEVGAKHQDLVDALTTMAAEAGNNLDALRTNMRAVGGGCKGCHDAYRLPKD